ncbi:MAG: 2-hydroxyacid dehydrogenase [Oscillatoriophycideae cyanobacterium NC_groundwater_1537_Pr4_S-0.65um_50_18]|nr:2-hydroxyacid dehydrogenase [Oscillatoriophycideae cyanobacterium NC_groundwater_1537_Pr4_S-0.65um_50_18]
MKVAVFSTKPYDRHFLDAANAAYGHELVYLEPLLSSNTASLTSGFPAVCLFVNDTADAKTLDILAANGTKLIALRCAGFNNVDLKRAAELGITVVRVPAYSPYSVAEFAVALLLTLNRKIHKAYNRVREGNFALDGLAGFDLHNRTVGVIGTGKIGFIFAEIMKGFGCEILGYDLHPNPKFAEAVGRYVELSELLSSADVISLHCPLTPGTRHLIDREAIALMKPGAMLINTSRGALVDTEAAIEGLKSRQIGALGLDVYEQEADLFFEDLSNEIIQDDVFERLLMFPNVIVTGHQAFLTTEALSNIAETTLANIAEVEQHRHCVHEVKAEQQVALAKALA